MKEKKNGREEDDITVRYILSASGFLSKSLRAVAADTTREQSLGDNSAALTRCSHASTCRDTEVKNSAETKWEKRRKKK